MKSTTMLVSGMAIAALTLLCWGLLSASRGNAQPPSSPSTSGREPTFSLTIGALAHGTPDTHLAAFLLAARRFKVGEAIPLSFGVVCVDSPPVDDRARRATLKVLPPNPPADPDNVSWFSVTGPDGRALPYKGPYKNFRLPQPEDSHLLALGQFLGHTSDNLARGFPDLAGVGKYRVAWHYAPPGGVAGCWRGMLVSNEIEIEIVP